MSCELENLGFTILNKVVLNQIVATIPNQQNKIDALVNAVNSSGDAWFGPTHWHGQRAFRISFSSWVTNEQDIETTVASIKRAATKLDIKLSPNSVLL
jgi:hypothetical protein